MPSKRQTHSPDKGSAEQTSAKPQTNPQVSDTFNAEILPASLSQRARIAPRSLSPGQVQHLQRTVGNRAVHQVLFSTGQSSPASPIIQRLVNRKQVEASAQSVMLAWFRSQGGRQKYAAVGSQYEALLEGLDVYHVFLNSSIILAYQDNGVAIFKQQMHNQISLLRSLCMALTLADDDSDLDQVVVNFVLDSLNQEEEIVNAIAQKFSVGIDMLNRQGWNGQFQDKTYRKAIAIGEFVLPIYGRGYSSESICSIWHVASWHAQERLQVARQPRQDINGKGQRYAAALSQGKWLYAQDCRRPGRSDGAAGGQSCYHLSQNRGASYPAGWF